MNRFNPKQIFIRLLPLFLLIGMSHTAVHAASRAPRVGINGATCAYETINAAVAAASAGDTIYIRGSFTDKQTYNERIGVVDKTLTFLAASSNCTSESTILLNDSVTVDGGGAAVANGGIIQITGETTTVTINKMTLQDATASTGGIAHLSDGTLILNGVVMEDGVATSTFSGGGAVYVFDGTLILNENTGIVRNETSGVNAAGKGGGVYLANDAVMEMNNTSSVSGNTGILGGGIFLSHRSSLTMNDTARITVNSAENGGGVYAGGLNPAGGGSIITMNDSAYIGGAFSPTGNTRNQASERGGGIYLNNTDQLIMTGNSYISANTAEDGGGIHASDQVTIELSGNSMIGGVDDYDGNKAVGTSATTGRGGGLHLSATASTIQLTLRDNSRIINNSAEANTPRGGGIYASGNTLIDLSDNAQIEQNESADDAGGVLLALGPTMTLTDNSAIRGNMAAGLGGGVQLDGGKLIVNDSAQGRPSIDNNKAHSGGGVYARVRGDGNDELTINGGDIISNTASFGGGLYLADVTGTLSNVVLADNSASSSGGGVYVGIDADLQMAASMTAGRGLTCDPTQLAKGRYCSEFYGNTGLYGAAIHVSGSADISHTSFSLNSGTGSADSSIISLSEGNTTLTNVLIADNSDVDRVINYRNTTQPLTIRESTIGNNDGHAILTDGGSGAMTIDNSILWGNTEGALVENAVTLSLSCNIAQTVAAGSQAFGGDTINADPQWFSTARGDYFLNPASPAVNKCNGTTTVDLENIGRPINDAHDMGAFESDGSTSPTAVSLTQFGTTAAQLPLSLIALTVILTLITSWQRIKIRR